jgi:hypothetical protein
MVNQLLNNDKISFVVARRFSSRGKDYEVGDDFPQEDTNKIETFVRSRYIIPVVDSIEDKQHIRHWHRHIRPKDEVLERLARDRVQLRMPDEYDSDEVVNIPQLTQPNTTEPDQEEVTPVNAEEKETAAEAVHSEQYDPSYHNVVDVNAHLATVSDPEEKERILQVERDGKARKGILEP